MERQQRHLKKIHKWLDKVLEENESNSRRHSKVFYYGKREHGIFHKLKQEELANFLANSQKEVAISWTRNFNSTTIRNRPIIDYSKL